MKRLIVLYLIANVLLTACSSATSIPDRSGVTQAPQLAKPTNALSPTAVASDTPAPVTPSPVQPIEYFLPDPAVGLDQLNSYQLTLTIAFKGQLAGQPANWQDVHTRSFSRDSAAQFTTLTQRDENNKPIQLRYGSVDKAHYFQKGDEACQVNWGERTAGSDGVNPAAMLPPVAAVQEVGQETINGIPAHHYSIGEELDGWQSAGELWLAVSGGYVIKYDLSIQAGEQFFGAGNEGTQTFQYELSDINALHDVALPAGCPEVLTEIPAMPDAIDLVRLPGSMSFTTPSSLESVSAFYQDKLKPLGWELLAQHDDSATQPALIFTRNKGEESAIISLQQEDAGVWVAIQFSKPTAH